MKKIMAIALSALILPLLLCGCFGGDGVDELKSTLAYPVAFTAETGELVFDITVKSAGAAEAKMTAPRTLAGLDLVRDGDNITASYKGMTVPLPEASAKKVFMLADIIDAVIASFADNSYVVEKGEDNNTVSVTCGDSVCMVTYGGDGSITSAEINCGGKRTVYNITAKTSEESASGAESSAKPNESKEMASDAEKSS